MKKTFFLYLLLTFTIITFSQPITWTEQTSGITTALNSVSSPDINSAWTCGNGGKVLRTVNGGVTWTSVSGAPIPATLSLYNIFGIDSSTALVTGSTASATFVYRTSNGGATWTQVFTQTSGFIDNIWMGNAQAGFMNGDPVGGRWSLWGTTNGGVSWDSTNFRLSQSGTETGYNNSFYFDNGSQTVWFGTNNTRIYRTTNLIIWSTQVTPGQVNSSALWFVNATNGMTGGTGMLFTNNGGIVWGNTPNAMPGTAVIVGVANTLVNTSRWVIVRNAPQIYGTPDNGTTWNTMYTAPAGNYDHLTRTRDSSNIFYAVRDNGGISKGFIFTVIHSISNNVPSEFSLKQNYPNPFNPETNIGFRIADFGFASIKIYNDLGQEIASLVNENLKPGSYEVQWDAANYPSGVYFYKLYATGGIGYNSNNGELYSLTKKMMLVK